MIGKVELINGVKQIVPLDDTLIPNISPATPNNSILQYENGVVKSAGYTTGEVVRYMGNFGTMSLSDIFTNYAAQNTIMYKGYLDYQDSRCPTSTNGIKDTVEITCFDNIITARTYAGIVFAWTATNPNWYEMNGVPIKQDLVANVSSGWTYIETAIAELLNNSGARYLEENRIYEGGIAATNQFSGTYQIYSYNTNAYLAITGTVNNANLLIQFWGSYTTNAGWVIKSNAVCTYSGNIATDGNGNALIAGNGVGPIPRTDVEIISVRSPTNNYPIMIATDSAGNVYGRVTGWGDWTPLANTTIDAIVKYRLL